MARAIAQCTCSKCGAKFEKVHFGYNRKDADQWKEWAEETLDTCPDCWWKEQQEKNAAKAAEAISELHLPEIVGKSERQIQYAADLRNKAVINSATRAKLEKIIKLLNSDKYKEIAEQQGISVEEAVGKMMQRRWQHPKLIKVVTSGEAREIIDALIDY